MGLFRRFFKLFNLFPCPACGRGDGNGENDFCETCLAAFSAIGAARHCRGCGGELDGVLGICSLCMKEKKRPWLDALSLYFYENEAREMILRFKSGRHPAIARPLGKRGAQRVREAQWRVDLVVPIPLHFFRFQKRGYNQSALFGKIVASELKIPFSDALRRRFSTGKQARRTRAGRHQSVKHLFEVKNPRKIAGLDLLLVDDVFTTGATCDAAARALLKAGARSVRLLTACRTAGHSGRG